MPCTLSPDSSASASCVSPALIRYWRRLGHTVEEAANGIEGRERLASRTYDRILLDVRMPELAGDVLYLELRDQSPDSADRAMLKVLSDRLRDFDQGGSISTEAFVPPAYRTLLIEREVDPAVPAPPSQPCSAGPGTMRSRPRRAPCAGHLRRSPMRAAALPIARR